MQVNEKRKNHTISKAKNNQKKKNKSIQISKEVKRKKWTAIKHPNEASSKLKLIHIDSSFWKMKFKCHYFYWWCLKNPKMTSKTFSQSLFSIGNSKQIHLRICLHHWQSIPLHFAFKRCPFKVVFVKHNELVLKHKHKHILYPQTHILHNNNLIHILKIYWRVGFANKIFCRNSLPKATSMQTLFIKRPQPKIIWL